MPAPLIAIELAAKAGTFLKQYWAQLSAGFAVLFLFTTFKGCGDNSRLQADLKACQEKPPVIQTQTVTVKQKCAGGVEIKYQPGSPCPDITARLDGVNDAALSQTQTASASTSSQPWRRMGVHWLYQGQHMGGLHADVLKLGSAIVDLRGSAGIDSWAVGASVSVPMP